jgi:hypothetical protein
VAQHQTEGGARPSGQSHSGLIKQELDFLGQVFHDQIDIYFKKWSTI